MFKYRVYNGSIFLYEGICDKKEFSAIQKKYSFGNYKLIVLE